MRSFGARWPRKPAVCFNKLTVGRDCGKFLLLRGGAVIFLEGNIMRATTYWLSVLALFFGLALSCDKCFAIEQHRFHSETNSYSFVIPDGWIQIPEDVVRQTYDKLFSSRTRSIIFNEAEFQLDSQDAWFEQPTIAVQVVKYSALGLTRAPSENEFAKFVKMITGRNAVDIKDKLFSKDVAHVKFSEHSVSKVSVDKVNRCYTFFSEIGVGDSILRSKAIGYFGKEILVQLAFNHSANADLSKFKDDYNLVFKSFKFDPLMAYKTPSKSESFWEKILVDAGVYGIVALVIVLIGLVGGLCKPKMKNKSKNDQNNK